jgi:putative transposase
LNQFINLCLESNFKRKKYVSAENFIHSLVDKYGKHILYTDGGTWYLQAYQFLI